MVKLLTDETVVATTGNVIGVFMVEGNRGDGGRRSEGDIGSVGVVYVPNVRLFKRSNYAILTKNT